MSEDIKKDSWIDCVMQSDMIQQVIGQLFGPSTLSLGQPQTAAMPKWLLIVSGG